MKKILTKMKKINNLISDRLKYKFLFYIYIVIILVGVLKSSSLKTVKTSSVPIDSNIIILDAGHGSKDPGKVAKDGTLEKDINLRITKFLQEYIEQAGGFVLNTRVNDSAISDNKVEDLKGRKNIANDEDASILISIHQNSFPKENVKGAQVFYYKESKESEKLAHCVQNRLKEIDTNNNRVAKENSSYYILKKTKMPSIIVECGFLSNTEEKNMLKTEEYQKKLAWAIYLGILDYYSV